MVLRRSMFSCLVLLPLVWIVLMSGGLLSVFIFPSGLRLLSANFCQRPFAPFGEQGLRMLMLGLMGSWDLGS
ncbi:hypothetical protein BHS05_33345 [Myxococcus xanthus]|uniref:Uncharacterized protein n=1 Tax=Myxococcus xanthus TaxID=34 RepID=A0AAE6G6F4_MYXXA|nr:hypothetical protein BHS09_33485 [Myxococcus xanthus]QDE78786.1 hypothetical protein BHS08_33505 [Myxococcus xanthus]QDF00332.1 hypothetical protein BHS05_33345 [Myxococcus xanthus]QDF08110.1 hypothetical protein BHS04_33610 [Myxococcus xanthus]